MNWSLWTLFVMTEAALSAAPGPAVLIVVSRGLRGPLLLGALGRCGLPFATVTGRLTGLLLVGAALALARLDRYVPGRTIRGQQTEFPGHDGACFHRTRWSSTPRYRAAGRV